MNTLRTTWATRSGKLILIVVAATLLCCAPVTILSVLSPTPTPTPTPTDRPTDTPTPIHTPTPIDTPTDTPTPRPTPAPTDTPTTAQFTPEEVRYRTSVSIIMSDTGKLGVELGGLFSQFQLGDEDWTLQVAAKIAIIKNNMLQLTQLTPPPGYESIHAELIEGAKDCTAAMDAYASGIDQINADLMQAANSLLDSCSQHFKNVGDMTLELGR